ncbi:hypothetical protein DFH09DRAFT_1302318 [Mycena vulgaris]|nr:hypothetical protein DFH09DRAFT_1302318 [Mycena vulgaris]
MDHEPCVHCPFTHTAETLEIIPPIHLSSTNIMPLESEVFDMRQTIHKGRARLSYLEAQIANLHKQIRALTKEHRDVQHQIHNVSGVLSPMRRVLAEILGEIFRWTLPTDISLAPPYLKQSHWNISRVSVRWRAISVAFPALCSQIGVTGGKENPIDALKT